MSSQRRISFAVHLALFVGLLGIDTVLAQEVQVNSADPASAERGTLNLDVTVAGKGFDHSAAVRFLVTGTTNPGGIAVNNVKVRGPKKLIANIDVATDALVADFDIEVEMYGGRKGKGTTLFAVTEGGSTNYPDISLRITFESWVGAEPSSLEFDEIEPFGVYVDKKNVVAETVGNTDPHGIRMRFHGTKWKGGRGRQMWVRFTCDDSLVGDCSDLDEYLGPDLIAEAGGFVGRVHVWRLNPYRANCPSWNANCPSDDVYTLPPNVPELMGLKIIAASFGSLPFIDVASDIGGSIAFDAGRCLSLLSQAERSDFLLGCSDDSFCNGIVTAFDDDPLEDGNDRWHVQAEGVRALICTDESVIGATTLSFEFEAERK